MQTNNKGVLYDQLLCLLTSSPCVRVCASAFYFSLTLSVFVAATFLTMIKKDSSKMSGGSILLHSKECVYI